ncbi:MAG: peptidoglycan-binding protein, partial [Clostridia bacterium]|nr:peptidoglycan-binding protein [Clostridia bacterium]
YLSRGMRGAEIEELQTLLRLAAENDPAIPAVERDGIFGPATEAAVRAAQETASLPVTGYVGPLTWDALVTLAGVK